MTACFEIEKLPRSLLFQQKDLTMIEGTGHMDGTYNAYEKDIAIASFYFEKPVVFKYKR